MQHESLPRSPPLLFLGARRHFLSGRHIIKLSRPICHIDTAMLPLAAATFFIAIIIQSYFTPPSKARITISHTSTTHLRTPERDASLFAFQFHADNF